MILYCATTNPGKIREFRLTASEECVIEPLPGLADIAPPEESGSTFEENARLKAEYYGRRTNGWLFAEDSGLEVDALGGAPGVCSARFAGPAASDDDNNRRLLELLAYHTVRTARYVCIIALAQSGVVRRTFHGKVEGEILREHRGTNGFGYDPLFYYPPFGCTFGEVERERKQSVSHRGQALRALLEYAHDLGRGESGGTK